jgi:putative membrane protein
VTRATLALALVGLAVATALVARAGFGTVVGAFAGAGAGVLWASLVHFAPMALNARAWQLLVGRGRGRSLSFFTWAVWVREAVNGLLPVARIGGEVASARLLMRRGIPGPQAGASLVADMTVSLVTQLVFTIVGIGALASRAPASPLARAAALGLLVAGAIAAVVVAAQRAGSFELLARVAWTLTGRRLTALVGSARRLDRATRAVYRMRGRVLRCAAWQLAGWAAGAAEIWAFLAFVGHRVTPVDALAIEAVVQALSSAAFLVPGALGIQEGAFLAVGGAVGLSADTALALALGRRARDLIVFVPALVAWQAGEARRLVAGPRARPREGGALP